jgi:hypothetical protein
MEISVTVQVLDSPADDRPPELELYWSPATQRVWTLSTDSRDYATLPRTYTLDAMLATVRAEVQRLMDAHAT